MSSSAAAAATTRAETDEQKLRNDQIRKSIRDQSPLSVDWKQVVELQYSTDGSTTSRKGNVCFHCSKDSQSSTTSLLRCSQCRVATYCSKSCQVNDWKKAHKAACSSYTRVGPTMTLRNETEKTTVRQELLAKIRYYAFPYAVFCSETLGRGFLFVQSNQTVATMSLAKPVDSFGRPTATRSFLLHYLTIGEYDAEVCRDDFELTHVRAALRRTVLEEYDSQKEVVVLMRFRCGHLALGVVPLVSPDYAMCHALGKEYYQSVKGGAVELQLDEL